MENTKKIFTGSSLILKHTDGTYLILGLGDHQTYKKIANVELKEIKLVSVGNPETPACFEIPDHAEVTEFYGRGWDFPYAT